MDVLRSLRGCTLVGRAGVGVCGRHQRLARHLGRLCALTQSAGGDATGPRCVSELCNFVNRCHALGSTIARPVHPSSMPLTVVGSFQSPGGGAGGGLGRALN